MCALRRYGVFAVDQLYIKHITDTVKMDSTWGRVFYSNFLVRTPPPPPDPRDVKIQLGARGRVGA